MIVVKQTLEILEKERILFLKLMKWNVMDVEWKFICLVPILQQDTSLIYHWLEKKNVKKNFISQNSSGEGDDTHLEYDIYITQLD